MTAKMTSEERAYRCGPFKVTRRGRFVYVTCASCGRSKIPAHGARILAECLEGPLGRFEVRTTKHRRLKLARDLRAAGVRRSYG